MALETDILKDLIRVKHECLLQLREAGRNQVELIDGGNLTGLMKVLAAKQRPLVTLQRVERALEPFRNQPPENRIWRSPDDRKQCSEELRQCETLLAEIVKQEKYCESILIKRRDEAAVQLQGAHLAGHARQAYLPQQDNQNSRLNLLSEK
jgi:hypothetical protein